MSLAEVLERRDALLRSLAQDHPFSLKTISTALRDAAANDDDFGVYASDSDQSFGVCIKAYSWPWRT